MKRRKNGIFLMSKGWSSIHSANGDLVTGGIYRYVRHPQYLGLIVITVGFAKREEREATEAYGERYEEYERRTPVFFPSIMKKGKAVS